MTAIPISVRGECLDTIPANNLSFPRVEHSILSLRNRGWKYAQGRVAGCGRWPVSDAPIDLLRGDSTATIGGVQHCGSVWTCPVCSSGIRRERAAEIAAAVEAHGAERIFMLTLTVRHGETISLKTAREGLSACWSKFVSGSQWARFRSRLGIVGYLRVLEVTHAKGWHPHLHVYLFVENPDQMDLEQYNFQARWRRLVGKNMGNAYEPTLSQGLTVTSVSDAADAGRYVEKLGLRHEKTRGEDESGARYPLEILDDLVEYKNRRDYRLWMEYQEGIFGARQLTWSVGLRDNLGLGKEKCDEELAPESGLEAGVAQEQVCETEGERKARRESERAANRERYERRKAAIERDRRERLICTIPVEIWREIVRYPLAEVTIRSIAQTDGWAGVWRYIRKVQSIQGTREVDSG